MKLALLNRHLAALATAAAAIALPASAQAADGCKFLLCIAGPWQTIPECVPTVQEVFSDLARGRPFPTCSMSGAGNSASHMFLGMSEACPMMYRRYSFSGDTFTCMFNGRVTVTINGQWWSDVFWNGSDTRTNYSGYAKDQLTGSPLDLRYEADQAAWDAAHPPPPADPGYGG